MKNRKKPKKSSREKQKADAARRKFLNRLITIGGVMAISGASYAAFKIRHKSIYDLSVLGNGNPTIVQIHDATCQLCKQLKANVESVKHEFDHIQFRIVNITSHEGAQFARKYDSVKTTLLVFDGNGELTDKLEGVYPEEQLRKKFSRL